MSRGFSRIVIVGNLGRDPEMRYTASGTAVVNFSVAVGRRNRGQDGNTTDETDWYRVSVFGRNAEIADQYLKKGRQVLVDGRLQIRNYTGNDGVERTSVEIVADNFTMLGPRDDAGGGFSQAGGGQRSDQQDNEGQQRPRREQKEDDFDDFDDVPF